MVIADKGVRTMAGTLPGAPAPLLPTLGAAQRSSTNPVPASSRTRLVHGALPLDSDQCITVYSSRRSREGLGVMLRMARGSLRLSGRMSPAQALILADALTTAAAAAQAVQSVRGVEPQRGAA
jgi:hypothetical protein